MRIIQVNKFLYRKAGAEAYVLDLAELLKAHGHEVMLWGTNSGLSKSEIRNPKSETNPNDQNPKSLEFRISNLLVGYLNFDQREGLRHDLRKFGHMVWSFDAARKFETAVREFKPELIHIHNIYHHISPSILAVARRHKIPVVMTVHDYHLINPNYTLYDHGEICERQGLRAIAHRCIKNSFVATAADVIEWNVHRWMKIYEKNIARFIAPTEFVKEKLVEGGVDTKKIEVVPLPVIHNSPQPSLTLREGDRSVPPLRLRGGRGSYVLFAGRLAEEKGIYVVLEIAKRLPEMKFKIAGDGPEKSNLQLLITNYQLQNVEFLGFQDKNILQQFIKGAKLVLVPSLWYDPSPFAVLEAMEAGKVVVASKIGGIPELIKDGETGFLIGYETNMKVHNATPPPGPALARPVFDPFTLRGGVADWIDMIQKVYYDAELLKQVGASARQYIKEAHDPEKHYEKIMEMYKAVGH